MQSRREFLRVAAGGVAALGAGRAFGQGDSAKPAVTKRDFMKELIYTREEVAAWLAEKAFPFAKYSSRYGWLLRNARFKDGIDKSWSTYTYSDGELGERVTMTYADKPCRINAYGDSFTMCHQVSDGETWEEVLAAHLIEPIRNFGIGGWSVYQAYLRMMDTEVKAPAELVILNIYGDDHYRNLDAWRNIRSHKHKNFIEPTLPYLSVDLAKDTVTEHANPCPTPESVYHLCELDWCLDRFGDDFVFNIELAHKNAKSGNPELAYKDIMALATTHGINTRDDLGPTADTAARELHTRAALRATREIIEWIEAWKTKHNKKVLYVLSFPGSDVAKFLETGERFDQPFVDYLKAKNVPVVDLMECHKADYADFRCSMKDYIERYYIGHYKPLGNLFTAFAIKDKVVELLDPKPIPYREP